MPIYMKSAHIGFDSSFRKMSDTHMCPSRLSSRRSYRSALMQFAPPLDKKGGANVAARFPIRFLG